MPCIFNEFEADLDLQEEAESCPYSGECAIDHRDGHGDYIFRKDVE